MGCSFEVPYFLLVLSLNSTVFLLVLFASQDPSPLYKSSKRKNHLKPENLKTLFLLSPLKMPINFVTSYQVEMKYLEEAFGNKIFYFFKKRVFAFLDEGTFQGGGSQVPQNFEGGCS